MRGLFEFTISSFAYQFMLISFYLRGFIRPYSESHLHELYTNHANWPTAKKSRMGHPKDMEAVIISYVDGGIFLDALKIGAG
jgi:hypothetical protein